MTKILPSLSEQDNAQSKNIIVQRGIINNAHFANTKLKGQGKKDQKIRWYEIFFWKIIVPLFLSLIAVALTPLITSFVSRPEQDVKSLEAEQQQTPSLTPTSYPSPTLINNCTESNFVEELWDTSQYYKNSDDYFLPKKEAREKFLFPKMAYKNKISGVFKKINIVYEATFQDKNSTTSATLFIALYDGNRSEVFEFNLPQPNRNLVGRKVIGNGRETDSVITPKPISPIHLRKKIPYSGTNEITITPVLNFKNNITYILSGSYIDQEGNSQEIYGETPAKLRTVTPSVKEFTFVVGTGRQGKLKIKKFSVCDE